MGTPFEGLPTGPDAGKMEKTIDTSAISAMLAKAKEKFAGVKPQEDDVGPTIE